MNGLKNFDLIFVIKKLNTLSCIILFVDIFMICFILLFISFNLLLIFVLFKFNHNKNFIN